jgi:hypothetical protein
LRLNVHSGRCRLAEIVWGSEPLPVVDKYKYLGVMLASDCTWQAHVEHVVAKATTASYAMGSVLHNRRLDTEIRRVVLLAKLRPVLEYCSTVWHAATDAQRSQLEGVMLRVMKRFLAVFENVHHDVLRMELGCRSLSSWMAQRALEYGFRLQRMPADRLPAAVNAAVWRRVQGAGRPRLCKEELVRVEKHTRVNVTVAVADATVGYGQFKRVASEAVRVADMRVVVSEERRTRQSTLAKYLQLIGPLPEGSMFPNECRPYLAGVVGRGAQLKFLLRAGMLPLGRLESRKRRRGAAPCPACGGPEEDATHFVFTCGALHAVRDQLYSRLDAITTGAFGQLMYDEPLDTALLGLLGDNYWGEQATAVDSCVRSFLVAAWAAREAAVAARGPTAVLEVALDAEPEPAPLSVRVRVPVGPVAGAAWGAGDQICADCHSRRSAGSMVQCRMCVRWYHRSCGGGSQASAVDWVCKACDVVVTPPSPGGSPPHDYRRQRREGPWRSR